MTIIKGDWQAVLPRRAEPISPLIGRLCPASRRRSLLWLAGGPTRPLSPTRPPFKRRVVGIPQSLSSSSSPVQSFARLWRHLTSTTLTTTTTDWATTLSRVRLRVPLRVPARSPRTGRSCSGRWPSWRHCRSPPVSPSCYTLLDTSRR